MPMPWFYRTIRFLALCCNRIFYRLRIYGTENCYDKGAIIAPNHASYLDPPIIAASWPLEIHFLASDYLFRVPLFSALIRKLNSHPVHRGRSDLKSIKMVCELLKDNKQVLIFPEGTRATDGEMAPLKTGVAMISLRTGAAVIPAYIHGSYKVWNRHFPFPKLWGKVAVVYGKPILCEEFDHLDAKQRQHALLVRLTEAIQSLRQWYESGAVGSPP